MCAMTSMEMSPKLKSVLQSKRNRPSRKEVQGMWLGSAKGDCTLILAVVLER